MSKKHDLFMVGQPGETKTTAHGVVKIRDELGLSFDPADHADPTCSACGGRGVSIKLTPRNPPLSADPEYYAKGMMPSKEDREWARQLISCGCSAKRYQKRRASLGAKLSLL